MFNRKIIDRLVDITIILFLLFSTISAINYFSSKDVFDANISYVNNQKLPYSVILNIDNLVDKPLNYNIEVINVKQNLVVSSKNVVCKNHCEVKLDLNKVFFDKYKIYIKTNIGGKLFRKILTFSLVKDDLKNFIVLKKNYFVKKGVPPMIFGELNLNSSSKVKIVIFPRENSEFKSEKDLFCRKNCNFNLTINSNILFGKYDVQVYLLNDVLKSEFNLIGPNLKKIVTNTNTNNEEDKIDLEIEHRKKIERFMNSKKKKLEIVSFPNKITLGRNIKFEVKSNKSQINKIRNLNPKLKEMDKKSFLMSFFSVFTNQPTSTQLEFNFNSIEDLNYLKSIGVNISNIKVEKTPEIKDLENKLGVKVVGLDVNSSSKVNEINLKKGNFSLEFNNTDYNNIHKVEVIKKKDIRDLDSKELASDVLYVSANKFNHTKVILKKNGFVDKILTCRNFSNTFCLSGWENANVNFNQNKSYVWFNVTHFSAYTANGGTYNFSILFQNTANRVIKQNTINNLTLNLSCVGGDCGGINVSLYSTDLDTDLTDNTCQNYWGSTCGDKPDIDNTFDACSTFGPQNDESVVKMWLSQTSALPGDVLNITCELDPYTSNDNYKIFYYNGTAWKRIFLATNQGSSNNVNISATFVVDNNSGMQYVRCGIDYNQNDNNDGCADSGNYYDNDDVGFLVGNLSLIPTSSSATPFWTPSSQNQQFTLNDGQFSLVNFSVNASGNVGDNTYLVSRAVKSTNSNILSQSQNVFISIADGQNPNGTKISPLNNATLNDFNVIFNVSLHDNTALGSAELFVWDSLNHLVYDKVNTVGGADNYSFWNVSFTNSDKYTWNVKVTDSGGNTAYVDGGDYILNIYLPELSVDWKDPISDTFKQKDKIFKMQVEVKCKNFDCGNVNVSLLKKINILTPTTFESGFGTDWTTSGGDCPFTRDKGGTPSGGTGPSIDHTLGTSSGYYIFTETSSGNNKCNDAGDNAYLYSKSFIPIDANLSFWWHAYGSEIGDLNLKLSDDNQATWKPLWSRTGQYQTASDQAFETQVYSDLSEYNKKNISLMLNMHKTKTGIHGDLGLDDIFLTGYKKVPSSGTPFYTTSSNPKVISNMKSGDTKIITFYVNASGALDTSELFKIKAESQSNSHLKRDSKNINITIKQETEVSNCGTLNANTMYKLTRDLTHHGSDCFKFGGSNILFNGYGHTIDGNGHRAFKEMSSNAYSNLQVKNIITSNWDYDFYFRDNNRVTLNNITAPNNKNYFLRCNENNNIGCSNFNVQNINVTNLKKDDAFYFENLSNSIFKNIYVDSVGNGGSTDTGFTFTKISTKNVLLENVLLNDVSGKSILFNVYSNGITLNNVTVNTTQSSSAEGIKFNNGANNLTFEDVNLIDTGDDGIEFVGDVSNSTLNKINIINAADYGINYDSFNNVILKNIFINKTTNNYGIYSSSSTINSYFYNVNLLNIGTDSDSGLDISKCNDTLFKNINLKNINYDGIKIRADSNRLLFENINMDTIGDDGFYFMGKTENITLDNLDLFNISNKGIYFYSSSNTNTNKKIRMNDVKINKTSNYGIYLNYANNSILKNVALFDTGNDGNSYGFYYTYSSNMLVNNMSLINSYEGIKSGKESRYNNFTNIYLDGINVYAFHEATNSGFNNVENFTALNIGGAVFYFKDNSGNNSLKNIYLNDLGDDTFYAINSGGNYFENYFANSTTVSGSYGIYFDSASSYNILKNITLLNLISRGVYLLGTDNYVDGLIVDAPNDYAFRSGSNSIDNTIYNTKIISSGQYGMYFDSGSDYLKLKNISVLSSSSNSGLYIANSANYCDLNNITVLNSVAEGIYSYCANSNYTNIFVNNSGTYGFYPSGTTNSLFENISIINSGSDATYFNNVDDSILRNITIFNFANNGLWLKDSANLNVSFSNVSGATAGNYNLFLDNSATDNVKFSFNYFELASKVKAADWSQNYLWNISTPSYPLGNYWDDLVCSYGAVSVFYNSNTYLTCPDNNYIVNSVNNNIDFGPLLKNWDNSNNISFVVPTPLNGSLSNTTISINVSESGNLQRSSFINFNNSLIGYWNFENVSGTTVYDFSNYNYDATLNNGAFISNSFMKRGNYSSLDGVNDFIDTNHDYAWTRNDSFSISAFVNTFDSNSVFPIIGKTNYEYTLMVKNDKVKFIYWSSGGSNSIEVDSTGLLTDNKWSLVTLTYNGINKTVKLYIDGVDQTNIITNDLTMDFISTGETTKIGEGYMSGGNNYYQGLIDEVMIVNRTLNVDEVKSLFNSNKYHLDTTFTNLSKNNNYNFSACNINYNGFINCTETRELLGIIDNVNPQIKFESPTPLNNSNIIDNEIYINVSVNESNIKNVTLEFNGVNESINCTGVSPNYVCGKNKILISEGIYKFRVFVSDIGSNINQTELRIINFSYLKPQIKFVAPTPVNSNLVGNSILVNVSENGTFSRSSYIDIDNSLSAYFSFKNVSGNIVHDDSTHLNSGTLMGNTFISNISKIRGNYSSFDGDGDYIEIPANKSLEINKNITISAWVKWNPFGDSLQNIYTNGAWDNALRIDNDGGSNQGKLFLALKIDGSDNSLYSNTQLNQTWTHVVGRYNGTEMSIFINGELDNSLSVTGDINSSNGKNYIGAESSGGGYFYNGSMDEVFLFNRSLSDGEIKSLYNSKVNSLMGNFSVNNTNYNFYACNIDFNGDKNCTETRASANVLNITLISPINNTKMFGNGTINFIWNISSSDSNLSCDLYINSVYNQTVGCNSSINNSLNITLNAGYYNWTINTTNSNNLSSVASEEGFYNILNKSNNVIKLISFSNNNKYKININVGNKLNFNQNITLIDFINSKFNYSSFNILYDWYNLSNSIFNGSILGWNLAIPSSSIVQINYSINKNLSSYHLLDEFIVGLD